MKPNPPRMVTVVLAIALTALGIVLIYLPPDQVADLVRQVGLPGDVQRTVLSLIADQLIAWASLAASSALLIVGSLVRGL